MIVSFPLLACHRAVAQAIAASGVSDIEDDPCPTGLEMDAGSDTRLRTIAWRSPDRAGNPYLNPAQNCPECGTTVVRASGCIGCPACGWGKCG